MGHEKMHMDAVVVAVVEDVDVDAGCRRLDLGLTLRWRLKFWV